MGLFIVHLYWNVIHWPEVAGELMRRGDGSLYDITVPGYKANLSDVLAAIAFLPVTMWLMDDLSFKGEASELLKGGGSVKCCTLEIRA